MYDTIVIGAGLAGLMAALRLTEAGQRVMMLAKGQGTTHWSTGCIDVWADTESPREALTEVLARQPAHPYSLAGIAGLEEALLRLRALCADAGYPLAGDLNRNLLLPTAVGALRSTCLVPDTMVAGDTRLLSKTEGGSEADNNHIQDVNRLPSLLVAGFRELRDFFPPLLAANLRTQGYAADGVYLEMPPAPRHLDFATASLARLFDQPDFRAHIGQQLRQLVKNGRYNRIALPAVLGLKQPLACVRDLQNASGAPVFEVPTLPASVPGMRLYNVLTHAIEQAGGRIQLNAEVVHTRSASSQAGGRLEAVYSLAAARQQEHRAERFVLATGGIAGGGVRGDHTGALHETALGLPVQGPDGRGAWLDSRFLSETGHPVFRSGVITDRDGHPLNAAGDVVYSNVFVAGAALAGADPIREGCAEGLALATGWTVAGITGV